MKLVYKSTGALVAIGDQVMLGGDGEEGRVMFFRKPQNSGSAGKVSVEVNRGGGLRNLEFYVGVIGAEWIEREDRE